MKLHHRKLQTTPPPTATTTTRNISPPTKEPTLTTPPPKNQNQQYTQQPFDSSMVLTILVLLTALFFMAFFSLYFRKFSSPNDPHSSSSSSTRHRRTRHRLPPPTTAGTSTTTTTNSQKGTDPEAIKSLPVYSFCGGEAKDYHQVECAICLGEFEERERVKMIPNCRHVFHLDCIDTWLLLHVTCPVCRGALFFVGGDGKDRRVGIGCGGTVGVESTVGEGDTSAVGERVLSIDSMQGTSSL